MMEGEKKIAQVCLEIEFFFWGRMLGRGALWRILREVHSKSSIPSHAVQGPPQTLKVPNCVVQCTLRSGLVSSLSVNELPNKTK